MNHFVVLPVAAFSLPFFASAASAGKGPTSAAQAGYNPGCEQIYQAGKPVIDPLVGSPLKALLAPMEAAFCGEQNHVPKTEH
jgi:hypothetical protein